MPGVAGRALPCVTLTFTQFTQLTQVMNQHTHTPPPHLRRTAVDFTPDIALGVSCLVLYNIIFAAVGLLNHSRIPEKCVGACAPRCWVLRAAWALFVRRTFVQLQRKQPQPSRVHERVSSHDAEGIVRPHTPPTLRPRNRRFYLFARAWYAMYICLAFMLAIAS